MYVRVAPLIADRHMHTHKLTHQFAVERQLFPATTKGESNYIKPWQQCVLCLLFSPQIQKELPHRPSGDQTSV